jgi:hypothetical protein
MKSLLDLLKKGPLAELFAPKADTSHWYAVQQIMQLEFGEILVDSSKPGESIAFFRNAVLLGDGNSLESVTPVLGGAKLDMLEAVGRGQSSREAIISLFQTLGKYGEKYGLSQAIEDPHQETESGKFFNRTAFVEGRFIKTGQYFSSSLLPQRSAEIARAIENLRSEKHDQPSTNVFELRRK